MRTLLFCTLLGLAQISNAALINRVDFGGGAIDYDFSGDSSGAATATDGNLTVSGGAVFTGVTAGPLVIPMYANVSTSAPIRLDFLSLVSAVGFDYATLDSNNDLTISVFDNTNTLLETHTIDSTGIPLCPGFVNPCGFAGVDVGAPSISYAILQAAASPLMLVDNVIYESSASTVPVPATLSLLTAGLLGFRIFRKKQS